MKLKMLGIIVGVINSLVLMFVTQTTNMACVWVFHQPEFPKEANKFKRMK